jgi:predicted nucleic-acid-binding protein
MSKSFPPEMTNFILDTNTFLRFLLNDIPEQSDEVSQLLSKAKRREINIYIPQIVIFEIEFALDKYYQFPKEEIVDKLGTLLATPYVNIQDSEIFQDALELFSIKNIDFGDCFLHSNSKVINSKLFTFDKDLQKIAD